jgi:hypothetical protein
MLVCLFVAILIPFLSMLNRELNLVFLNPRLKPGMESKIAEIEAELKCALDKVLWLPGFYAIPPEIQIAGSKAYQQGKVRGIHI